MEKGIRELNKEQTREELLKSAHHLFCQKDFHSVSIDEIALEAMVTKGAFYHHFVSKNDIFEKCFVLQAQRIERVLSSAIDSHDPFESAILKANAFLEFIRRERRNLIPLDEVITVLGWRRWKEIDIFYTMKFITESLRKLQEQQLIKDISMNVVADTIHGLLANLAMIIASKPKDEGKLKEAMTIFEDFLKSLKTINR